MKRKQKSRKILLYANFLHIFGLSMLAPVYALYGLKVGASPWQIGASWGLYNLIAGCTNIIVGRLEDGSRRNRNFVVCGYAITIIGILLFLFVKQPLQLYYVQIVNAIGVGLYMPAWKLLYSRAEVKGREASEWGMFDGGNMIAMAIAAALAGYIVQQGQYKLLFLVIIVFYSFSALVALRIPTADRN